MSFISRYASTTVAGYYASIDNISYRAHDVALSKQHKSISASDVLKALEVIELGDLAEQLQPELAGESPINFVFLPRLSVYFTVYRDLSLIHI